MHLHVTVLILLMCIQWRGCHRAPLRYGVTSAHGESHALVPFGGTDIVVKLGDVFLVQVPGCCQVTQAQQSFQGDASVIVCKRQQPADAVVRVLLSSNI